MRMGARKFRKVLSPQARSMCRIEDFPMLLLSVTISSYATLQLSTDPTSRERKYESIVHFIIFSLLAHVLTLVVGAQMRVRRRRYIGQRPIVERHHHASQ